MYFTSHLNYSRLDPYQHASVPESINMKNMLFPDVKIDLRRNIKRGFYTLYQLSSTRAFIMYTQTLHCTCIWSASEKKRTLMFFSMLDCVRVTRFIRFLFKMIISWYSIVCLIVLKFHELFSTTNIPGMSTPSILNQSLRG